MKLYYYIIKKFSKWFSCFNKSKDTRFYYLSLMKNTDNINGYCIHGLWPQYEIGAYPQYCKKVPFDIKDLELLKEDLEKYWTPKNIKNPLKFWIHEWRKHGSCIFTDITQYEYFKITLDLYKKVIHKNLICDKYVSGTHVLIPVSLDFKLIDKT